MIGSSRPERTVRITNAANQGIESTAVKKNSVPIAAVNAQRLTALEATNPPSAHCRRNGSVVIIATWLRRKGRKLFVRAKNAMLAIEATWYANGIAAATGMSR